MIPIVDKIFSEYGIPDTLRTDNGPPFNSSKFAEFAMSLGFKHRKITPLWPRANAEVERFMKTIKSAIRAARVERKCWKQEMFRFLRNYRATPHCSTGYPPATLLCGRVLKTKLPEIREKQSPDWEVEARDLIAKKKMKQYADSKQYVKQDNLNVGDSVLLKKGPSFKKDVPYHETPFTVTATKGTMVTATDGFRSVTRNSSYYKQLPSDTVVIQNADDDSGLKMDNDDATDLVVMDTTIQTCSPDESISTQAEPTRPRRDRYPPMKFNDYEHYKLPK